MTALANPYAEKIKADIRAAVHREAEALCPDRIDAITDAAHAVTMRYVEAFAREISPGFLQRTIGKKDDAPVPEAIT